MLFKIKKLITALLLACSILAHTAHAAAVAARGGSSSSSVAARTATVNVAQLVAMQAAINSMLAAEQAEASANNTQRITQSATVNPVFAAGVLTCGTSNTNIPGNGNYMYDGCANMSINDYFNKYKPNYATKITMVIFDREHQEFDIYYQ